jgi:hypothetical protein
VPLYGLALTGVWGAAFGSFGPRRQPERRDPRPSPPA